MSSITTVNSKYENKQCMEQLLKLIVASLINIFIMKNLIILCNTFLFIDFEYRLIYNINDINHYRFICYIEN